MERKRTDEIIIALLEKELKRFEIATEVAYHLKYNEVQHLIELCKKDKRKEETITKNIPLFVIRQRDTDQYWNNSDEHGTGWQEGRPKQAFSQSELLKQIQTLIDNNWFEDCEILQLQIVK